MNVQEIWLGAAIFCSTAYIVFRMLEATEGEDDGS
jgi:hypothetical protein